MCQLNDTLINIYILFILSFVLVFVICIFVCGVYHLLSESDKQISGKLVKFKHISTQH